METEPLQPFSILGEPLSCCFNEFIEKPPHRTIKRNYWDDNRRPESALTSPQYSVATRDLIWSHHQLPPATWLPGRGQTPLKPSRAGAAVTLSDEGCHIKTIRSSQIFLSDNTTIFENYADIETIKDPACYKLQEVRWNIQIVMVTMKIILDYGRKSRNQELEFKLE